MLLVVMAIVALYGWSTIRSGTWE